MKKQKESRVSDLFEISDRASRNQTGYVKILEWLYTHDGTFSSREEWRKALLEVIKENL